jgi:hypothetical protein
MVAESESMLIELWSIYIVWFISDMANARKSTRDSLSNLVMFPPSDDESELYRPPPSEPDPQYEPRFFVLK